MHFVKQHTDCVVSNEVVLLFRMIRPALMQILTCRLTLKKEYQVSSEISANNLRYFCLIWKENISFSLFTRQKLYMDCYNWSHHCLFIWRNIGCRLCYEDCRSLFFFTKWICLQKANM